MNELQDKRCPQFLKQGSSGSLRFALCIRSECAAYRTVDRQTPNGPEALYEYCGIAGHPDDVPLTKESQRA